MSYNSTHTGAQIDAAVDAVANKQDKLISGTNIKTVNKKPILGAGNLSLDDLISSSGCSIDLKEDCLSIGFYGNDTKINVYSGSIEIVKGGNRLMTII